VSPGCCRRPRWSGNGDRPDRLHRCRVLFSAFCGAHHLIHLSAFRFVLFFPSALRFWFGSQQARLVSEMTGRRGPKEKKLKMLREALMPSLTPRSVSGGWCAGSGGGRPPERVCGAGHRLQAEIERLPSAWIGFGMRPQPARNRVATST